MGRPREQADAEHRGWREQEARGKGRPRGRLREAGRLRTERGVARRKPDGAEAVLPAQRPPKQETRKARFCMFHLQGVCRHAEDTCPYAHSLEEMHGACKSRWESSTEMSLTDERPAARKTPAGAASGLVSAGSKQLKGSSSRGSSPSKAAKAQARPSGVWPELHEPMFLKPLAVSIQGERPRIFASYGHVDNSPVPHLISMSSQGLVEKELSMSSSSGQRTSMMGKPVQEETRLVVPPPGRESFPGGCYLLHL